LRCATAGFRHRLGGMRLLLRRTAAPGVAGFGRPGRRGDRSSWVDPGVRGREHLGDGCSCGRGARGGWAYRRRDPQGAAAARG